MHAFYNGLLIKMIIFIAGGGAGSLVCLVTDRIPMRRSLSAESECPYCESLLWWYEKIPILSWIFLRGRCRYCETFYGFQDIVCEMGMAVLWSWICHLYGLSLLTAVYLGIVTAMGMMAAIDFFYNVVLLRLNLILLILAALTIILDGKTAGDHLAGGVIISLPVLVTILFTGRKGISNGTVILVFSCGLSLGVSGSLAVIIWAFLVSLLTIPVSIILKKKTNLAGATGALCFAGWILVICFNV